MNTPSAFTVHLKLARQTAKLSLNQVGRLLGTSATYIYNVETGRSAVSAKRLDELLDIYSVSNTETRILLHKYREQAKTQRSAQS